MPFADFFHVGRRRQEPNPRRPNSQGWDADAADAEEEKSHKELRSLRIKDGLRRKQSLNEEKLNSLEQDTQQRIARLTFGGWAAGSKGTAAKFSEDFSYFEDEYGNLQGYSTTSRVDSQVFRAKAVGVLSHVQAQKDALLEWLGKQAKSHVILTRICDDTNAPCLRPMTTRIPFCRVTSRRQCVLILHGLLIAQVLKFTSNHIVQCLFSLHCHKVWIQRGGPVKKPENQENAQSSRPQEKKTRKVSPVLGIIQKVAARSQHGVLQFAQVHAPSQVLPKARSYHCRIQFLGLHLKFQHLPYWYGNQTSSLHAPPGEYIYHSGSIGEVVGHQWGQVQRTFWRTSLF